MNYYVVISLFALTICGCKFDSSGTDLPFDPYANGNRIDGYDQFGCGIGFVYNEDAETCDCPDNFQTFGDRDCYQLPENYYHSDMNGCFSDIGMAFEITQDSGAYFTGIDAQMILINQLRPRVDNRLYTDQNKIFVRDIGSGKDSVFMEIRFFNDYNPGDEDTEWFKMNFTGISNRQDSISGEMSFNRDFLDFGTANEFDRCDIVFIRTLQ